ncbi:MAG: glycerate dehydrogenase, partial [Thermomicrobiales bacterium]|nr:glycerate dehydrogenase [Thermomicrobiales bacterium]
SIGEDLEKAIDANLKRVGRLREALRAGRILGAGLDVFEREPPPPDHPLFTLPNVVVTPRVAAGAEPVDRIA